MAAAWHFPRWEREKSTWPHHDLSRFVDAGGIRWHVQSAGSGPGLLLVHGTGASTHSWRELIPMLAQNYTVFAADLPGHGFTEAVPSSRRSIQGMSASMNLLLRALDFKPDYCVGHSAGAVILCRMSLDAYVDPRVIISVNGAFLPLGGSASGFLSPIAKLLGNTSFAAYALARLGGRYSTVARVLAGTGSQLDARGIDLYRRLVSQPEHLAGALGMMGSWDLDTFWGELVKLQTPLVLIAGANDLTVPVEQAVQVGRRVANARVVRLPNLGHLAHEEAPAVLVDEILKICRTFTVSA